jgi:hypothetical protein
MLECFLIEDIC